MNEKYKNIISVLTISTGCVVLFLINDHRYFLTIAVILGVASLLSPYFASKISLIWMWIGKILGHINNTILLLVLFFVVLTPLALLSNRKRKRISFMGKAPENSTFTKRDHTFKPADLENIW